MAEDRAPPAPLASEASLAAAARYAGDIWLPNHPYFAAAELAMDALWRDMLAPQLDGCDLTCVLDLATGHGRNAARLLPMAQRMVLVDIQPGNIEACRRRFGDDPRIDYIVTNGWTLPRVADASVTLFFSFDAMVHFDSDVIRAYLREAQRVMAPGARAFLHHSNHTATDDWKVAPHNRAFMSAEFFAHYARKEGLRVLRQQLVDWGGYQGLDCFTHLVKDA